MQPKIVKHEKLCITGITGDGNKTGEVWNEFERIYDCKPFPKINESGYEIRFIDGINPAQKGMDVHVGFQTARVDCSNGFVSVALPSAAYAIFDICVTNGYDSGNAEMDKWLVDNISKYKQLEMNGVFYVIEVYNEKFAHSIVEFWIPICTL